jgi:hypothetical protein
MPAIRPVRSNVWYLAMILCFFTSILIYISGTALGWGTTPYAVAQFLGIWAPSFGLLGVRSELISRSGVRVE